MRNSRINKLATALNMPGTLADMQAAIATGSVQTVAWFPEPKANQSDKAGDVAKARCFRLTQKMGKAYHSDDQFYGDLAFAVYWPWDLFLKYLRRNGSADLAAEFETFRHEYPSPADAFLEAAEEEFKH